MDALKATFLRAKKTTDRVRPQISNWMIKRLQAIKSYDAKVKPTKVIVSRLVEHDRVEWN